METEEYPDFIENEKHKIPIMTMKHVRTFNEWLNESEDLLDPVFYQAFDIEKREAKANKKEHYLFTPLFRSPNRNFDPTLFYMYTTEGNVYISLQGIEGKMFKLMALSEAALSILNNYFFNGKTAKYKDVNFFKDYFKEHRGEISGKKLGIVD